MIKLLLILIVGLVFESTGVVLLKKGIDAIGQIHGYTAAEIFRVVKTGVTNPQILLGVFFEALFFLCLLILMSKSEISFLWPLTALSFVFATFAAIWFRRTGFRHALGWRDFDHDWRRVHQLQPAREGKTRAANGQSCSTTRAAPAAPPDARQRVPTELLPAKARRQSSRRKFGFLLQFHQRSDFSRRLGDGPCQLAEIQTLFGLASALKSSGKSSFAVSEITRTVTQGMPRSAQTA